MIDSMVNTGKNIYIVIPSNKVSCYKISHFGDLVWMHFSDIDAIVRNIVLVLTQEFDFTMSQASMLCQF